MDTTFELVDGLWLTDTTKPELLKIKKVGHDLDKAIAKGMTDIFEEAQNVWCTQHMKERDAQKLKAMGCNERTQRRIMADICGCQGQILLENGLADSEEPADFEAKLALLVGSCIQ